MVQNGKIYYKILLRLLSVAMVSVIMGIISVTGFQIMKNNAIELEKQTQLRVMVRQLKVYLPRLEADYLGTALYINDQEKLALKWQNAQETETLFRDTLQQIMYLNTTQTDTLDNISSLIANQWLPLKQEFSTAIENKDTEKTFELLDTMVSLSSSIESEIDDIFNQFIQKRADTYSENQKTNDRFISAFIILCIITITLAFLQSNLMAKQITNPIHKLALAADKLSHGDVRVDLAIHSDDEIGLLANSLQKVADGFSTQAAILSKISNGDYTVTVPIRSNHDVSNMALKKLTEDVSLALKDLDIAASDITGAIDQVAVSAQYLATSAAQQAASVNDIAKTMQEIQSQTQQVVLNTKAVTKADKETVDSFQNALDSMKYLSGAMDKIEENSTGILKIIQIIEDVAFQTNILSLNAAIEAARAGLNGKGFAVVSNEVRDLAARSSTAAKESFGLIEECLESVETGSSIVSKMRTYLLDVSEKADYSSLLLEKVTQEAVLQSEKIIETGSYIQEISEVVNHTAQMADEMAATAEEMATQSHLMQDIVKRFKINNYQ